jgi:general secretion pathway protein K
MRISSHRTKSRRGGALLAVLWLSVALATIALAVATRVRAETERSSTLTEGLQAKYVAEGAIHRSIIANIRRASVLAGARRVDFPNGYAIVEIIPESARLDINKAAPDDLARLLMALGAPPAQASETAAAIVDWRTQGGPSAFDSYYLAQSPSFRARHASIEEIEELLFVKGMTPELFYGAYARDAQGRLTARGGFRDCVSPQGSVTAFDAAGIEPALLLALGAPPAGVEQIRRLRAARPIGPSDLPQIQALAGAAANRLRYGGNTIYTFRATAFLNSAPGVRRTMEATVKYFDRPVDVPFHVTRWRETSTSDFSNLGVPGWQR